jgi:hypothetical protein
MLARSNGLPLEMEIPGVDADGNNPSIAIVANQLNRVTRLVVSAAKFAPCVNEHNMAPLLSFLEYRGWTEPANFSRRWSLLSNAACRLTTLRLIDYPSGLQQLIQVAPFPQLRSLAITTTGKNIHRLPVQFILRLLQKTPCLKYLAIRNILDDEYGSRSYEGEEVSLPHLASLDLLADISSWKVLLEYLSAPRGMRLQLSRSGSSYDMHSISFLPKAIYIHHPVLCMATFEFRMRSNSLPSVRFCAWSTTQTLSPVAFRVSLEEYGRRQVDCDVLAACLRINWDYLQVLTVAWPCDSFVESTMLDMLGGLPQLHSLTLAEQAVPNLVHWFASLVKQKPGSFRALRHMTITGVDILRRYHHSRANAVTMLADALESRTGDKVESLTIHCVRPHPWKDRMSKLVGTLTIIDIIIK